MPRRGGCKGVAAPPQITTPMVALAYSILHFPGDPEREVCARLLAELVLEAAERTPR